MINKQSLTQFAHQTCKDLRFVSPDFWDGLVFMNDWTADFLGAWNPEAQPGETLLAKDLDEEGHPVAAFIKDRPNGDH